LVVAGGQIMARLHALDRMAVLIHVEDAEPDRESVERVDANFPGCVERSRVHGIAHRSEALPAAEIVHAIHERLAKLQMRDADHGVARHDVGELLFRPTDGFGEQSLAKCRVDPGLGHDTRAVARYPYVLGEVAQLVDGLSRLHAALVEHRLNGIDAMLDGGSAPNDRIVTGHVYRSLKYTRLYMHQAVSPVACWAST